MGKRLLESDSVLKKNSIEFIIIIRNLSKEHEMSRVLKEDTVTVIES